MLFFCKNYFSCYSLNPIFSQDTINFMIHTIHTKAFSMTRTTQLILILSLLVPANNLKAMNEPYHSRVSSGDSNHSHGPSSGDEARTTRPPLMSERPPLAPPQEPQHIKSIDLKYQAQSLLTYLKEITNLTADNKPILVNMFIMLQGSVRGFSGPLYDYLTSGDSYYFQNWKDQVIETIEQYLHPQEHNSPRDKISVAARKRVEDANNSQQ